MTDKSKILVVDDEPSVGEVLSEFFTPKGYEVICASGGIEGLSKAEKMEPDVILLDVRMPDLDGISDGVHRHLEAQLVKARRSIGLS